MTNPIKISIMLVLACLISYVQVENKSYGSLQTTPTDFSVFKKDYHYHYKDIMSRYNRFVADCNFTHNIVDMKNINLLFDRSEKAGEKKMFRRHFVYKMKDSQKQIRIQFIYDHRRNSIGESSTVFNVGKDYRFKLEKKANGDYSLKEFGPSIAFEKDLEELYLDPIHFPLKIYNTDLEQLIQDESFRVKSCDNIFYENKDCIKIIFELNSTKNKVLKSGYFILSPADGWIILRNVCDLRLPNGTILPRSYDCKIDYNLNGKKYPPIKKIDVAWLRYRKIYDFENYNQIDVDDREFTLSSFGLPEIGVQAESINRYGPLVSFFIIGAILVFIGFVVFFLARKASRSRNKN